MKLAKEAIKVIGTPETVGEKINLDIIKLLENTPEPKTEIDELITDFFFANKVRYALQDDRFTSLELEKKYVKRLHSMLNSKTDITKKKRQESIMYEFTGWGWNIILNQKDKTFCKILSIMKI